MLKGFVFLLISSFSFAVSTVFAKYVNTMSDIPGTELTFFRFSSGFIMLAVYIAVTGKTLRPNKKRYILIRSLFNTAAVIFFFMGIERTTVSKSNMLNMTYPIFVFLVTPFINREKISKIFYLYLILTMVGIFFIMSPESGLLSLKGGNIGDFYGLLSGILAGIAISSLREARKYDQSYIILFYLMMIGTIINSFLIIPGFIVPTGIILVHTVLATVASLGGQLFLTIGYKYIKASQGSLVSSSRILFGIILGVSFFADPLSLKIITGALLIILSLVGVSGVLNRNKNLERV